MLVYAIDSYLISESEAVVQSSEKQVCVCVCERVYMSLYVCLCVCVCIFVRGYFQR